MKRKYYLLGVLLAFVAVGVYIGRSYSFNGLFAQQHVDPIPLVDDSPIVNFQDERVHLYVCWAIDPDRLRDSKENMFDVTQAQCRSLKEFDLHCATMCETLEDLLLMENIEELSLYALYNSDVDVDSLRIQNERHSQDLLAQLSEILPQLKNLTTFSIGVDFTVYDLSFLQSVHGLETLVVDGCPEDISEISNMSQLKWVGFRGELEDLSPLGGLQHLEMADLRNNKIKDITPLLGLGNIKTILLEGNPVCEDAEQMQMLREALPDAEIDYFNQ